LQGARPYGSGQHWGYCAQPNQGDANDTEMELVTFEAEQAKCDYGQEAKQKRGTGNSKSARNAGYSRGIRPGNAA